MRNVFVAAVLLALPTAALAQEGEAEAKDSSEASEAAEAVETAKAEKAEKAAAKKEKEDAEKEASGPFSAGRVVLRGGIDLDLNQSFNIGGSNTGSRIVGGVGVGAGYFIIDNLELDADLSSHFYLNPPEISDLALTPGAR